MKKFKKAIGFGSINPLHYGHIKLIQKAKEISEIVIIGLDTDEFLTDYKKKILYQSFNERYNLLKEIKSVDMIVEQSEIKNKMYWIKQLNCDMLFVGDDHKNTNWEGEQIAKLCEIPVVYFPHTKEIHSQDIIELAKGKLK